MKIYTTREAAEASGVHVNTVKSHAQQGRIGQKHGPRAWVFTEQDVHWLKRHVRVGGAREPGAFEEKPRKKK